MFRRIIVNIYCIIGHCAKNLNLAGLKNNKNLQEQRREADTTPKIVDWNEHMRMTSRQFGRWKQVLTVVMIAGKICIWKLPLFLSTNMHFAQIILYETKIDRYVFFRILDVCNTYLEIVTQNGIIPFVVFDGLPLPAKEDKRND